MGSERSSSHTISGQENPPLLTLPNLFSLPPSQPQGTFPALTKAEQITLALPITCPQRPAPHQSKGASLGTAVTWLLLQGDQQKTNTLNHCKGGKRSVMLLSGTSLLSWKAGNTQLHHFRWLSTPQEARVQFGNTFSMFQHCQAPPSEPTGLTYHITLPRPSSSPWGWQFAWLLHGHLAFGLLVAF